MDYPLLKLSLKIRYKSDYIFYYFEKRPAVPARGCIARRLSRSVGEPPLLGESCRPRWLNPRQASVAVLLFCCGCDLSLWLILCSFSGYLLKELLCARGQTGPSTGRWGRQKKWSEPVIRGVISRHTRGQLLGPSVRDAGAMSPRSPAQWAGTRNRAEVSQGLAGVM